MIFYKFVVLILGSLGISGCSKSIGPEEYGCPHADYKVSGTVVKTVDQAPIEGIEIEFNERKVYSNEEGDWVIDITAFPCGSDCRLIVRDIDGAEKGGSFKEDSLELDLKKTGLGSGDWYHGTFEQHDIIIEMEESG